MIARAAILLCFALFLLSSCGVQSQKADEIIWEEVELPESKGEIRAEPTAQETGVLFYVKTPVLLRSAPSYDSKGLWTVAPGECVICELEGEDGWDLVICGEESGYIDQEYLTKDPDECASESFVFASYDMEKDYPAGWLEAFNARLAELQEEYPAGKYWNHRGSETENPGVTDKPCSHSTYGTAYCNRNDATTALYLGFDYGTQCTGFSGMLSDEIFGKDAPIRSFKTYADLKIGDEARINANSHTVFIVDKTDSYVVVAECNADYQTCRIDWGRRIFRYRLNGTYLTRWE